MIEVPVEVKEALKDGRLKKNYKISVLNDDGSVDFVIDNDNLVDESVSIDERLNSGSTMKYGLCEGSSLEFQYFDKDNVTKRRLKVDISVEYYGNVSRYDSIAEFRRFQLITIIEEGDYRIFSNYYDGYQRAYLSRNGQVIELEPEYDEGTYIILHCYVNDTIEVEWDYYPINQTFLQKKITYKDYIYQDIPLGYFDVKELSRQASTGIYKVVAYNKLMGEYLDNDASEMVATIVQRGMPGEEGNANLYYILKNLLSDYSIEERKTKYNTSLEFPVQAGKDYDSLGVAYQYSDGQYVSTGNVLYVYHKKYYDSSNSVALDGRNVYYLNIFIENYRQIMSDILNYHSGFFADKYIKYNSVYWSISELLNEEWGDEQYTHQFNELLRALQGYVEITLLSPSQKLYYPLYKEITTEDLTGLSSADEIKIVVPVLFSISDEELDVLIDNLAISNWGNKISGVDVYEVIIPEIEKIWVYGSNLREPKLERFTNVTLRDLQSAVYEVECQYGHLDRQTDLFSGITLNGSRLYPAENLYPNDQLYPNGSSLSSFASTYSQLWANEGDLHKWRNLVITYKGLNEDNQEQDYTLQRIINEDGIDDYIMSDNWLFRNLIWTAYEVGLYADAMVAKMQDITWFPFEIWLPGLPYIETGDEIEVSINGNTYPTYVLQRQLNGIQNLQDTYINGTLDIF